ncbi:hypothetical protein [Kitasatospora kifunensis]|uniref:Uncharacterized protein n=1 Tax=Kitasatospora kifunensis TaxID=58351 RepID=A0A7W7VSY4_KITKI|nr:hypothetical protein [Kitasatospora kifunensis]MBB4921134.1 hypothetical protein [Kitasatospora kifunensis]
MASNAVAALTPVAALWFLFSLREHGTAGLAERTLTGVQTVWPFLVVSSCLRYATRVTSVAGQPGPAGLPAWMTADSSSAVPTGRCSPLSRTADSVTASDHSRTSRSRPRT